MNRRIAYNNLFLPNDINNGFMYKGEQIVDIDIYLIHRIIDKKTGREIYYGDENFPPRCQKIVYYDLEKGYIVKRKDGINNKRYKVTYTIGDCFKRIFNKDNPVLISYREFMDILIHNKEQFNNSNNKPVQSVAYYYEEV
ncbi:MAG: hypothetical protein K2M73_07785 [Lachnospiraceae bacterium]|nr:hypothetical protein [Lachnospiraceae bacterium]